MKQRIDIIKERVFLSAQTLLEQRPEEGPQILRQQGLCIRGRRILVRTDRRSPR